MRTSFSLRNSATSTGGGRGWGARRASGAEAPSFFSADLAELKLRAPEEEDISPPFADDAKEGVPEVNTGTLGVTRAAPTGVPPRRGMPREVKTCSTMRAMVERSGAGATAAAAARAGDKVVLNLASAAAGGETESPPFGDDAKEGAPAEPSTFEEDDAGSPLFGDDAKDGAAEPSALGEGA